MIKHTTEVTCDTCDELIVREEQTQISDAPLAILNTRMFRMHMGGAWWDMCDECRNPIVSATREILDERAKKLKPHG